MALTPAALAPVKPPVVHPRLAELWLTRWLIRCQTSLNSLIYGASFANYVRVTDSSAVPALGATSTRTRNRHVPLSPLEPRA